MCVDSLPLQVCPAKAEMIYFQTAERLKLVENHPPMTI